MQLQKHFGLIALVLVCALAAIFGAPVHAHAADYVPYMAGALAPINAERLGIAFTGFKTAFNQRFNGTVSQWERVATMVPSSAAEEKYGWFGQWPRLREWIGDRQIKNLALHDYSIKNKKFEATIAVPREYFERDTYGIFTPMFAEMGYAAKTHPDELVFALLGAGFTNTCYDGQYFFDTDHPVGGASVSNCGAGSSDPWFLLDTRRPLKPLVFQKEKDYQLVSQVNETDQNVFMRGEFNYGVDARGNVGFAFWQQAYGSKAALDATSFNAARLAMESLKSDEGRPLGITPDLLVCGPSNRAAAEALLLAQIQAAGATNTLYKAVDLMVCPWL